MSKLLSLYGLKFHPFRPDVPPEALFTTPAVEQRMLSTESIELTVKALIHVLRAKLQRPPR